MLQLRRYNFNSFKGKRYLSFFNKLNFNFDNMLSEDEKLIQDTARHFAQNSLQPRVLESFRNEMVRSNETSQQVLLAAAMNNAPKFIEGNR